jgi:hypothetical protein
MRLLIGALALVCVSLAAVGLEGQDLFDTPLRINMGGPQTVDAYGRRWLGDAAGDALGILPDDGGADADSYVIEALLPNDTYNLSMFFCESGAGGAVRHFTVSVQDVVVSQDTHSGSYAEGAQQTGRVGVEDVVVDGGEGSDSGILKIELVGCPDPDCPGGVDINPILNAIEIVPSGFTLCDDPGVGECASGLICAVDQDSGVVTGSWTAPLCVASLSGYELFRDGESIGELGAGAMEFTDEPSSRVNEYELVSLFDGGGAGDDSSCAVLSCTAVMRSLPFALPVRLNMGGDTTIDSQGDLWLGDRPCGLPENADPLELRPNDNGGGRAICNWCPPLPDSIDNMGFDGNHPGDRHIFSTIRWDEAAEPTIYTLEIPLPEGGEYDVSLFFNECCCDFRHFRIELQGEIVN